MKIMLDDGAFIPERAHRTDAGIDLKSPVSRAIKPHGAVRIDTGVHVQLPHHTAGLLVSKSGLNVKHGITSTGLIDEGYTGSIVVKMYNNSDTTYIVHRGDKISQLVVIPVRYEQVKIVDKLGEKTERGSHGFGSTGV